MGMDVAIQERKSRWPYGLGAGGVLLLAAISVGLGGLKDAAPSVPRASVWIGTVERGELLREVSGPGRLVPEAVRVVSAAAAGTVQVIHVEPGAQVQADTLLLELDNPELELRALEVAGDVKGAEATLLDLKASLAIDGIEQRARVQNVEMQHRAAQRQASANEHLASQAVIAQLTLVETRERAAELAERLQLEREHVQVLDSATRARVAAQRAQVERLKAQQTLREGQVAALSVRAGSAGVVQELPLEVGEQVSLGARLAKVVDPTRLRAELRIPETRAEGIVVGQPARIDIQGTEVQGRVAHIDPAVQGGSVTVDVSLAVSAAGAHDDGPSAGLPAGAKLDLSVDGRIELDRFPDVLRIEKPALGGSKGRVGLFKLSPDGHSAVRVAVELGASSVNAVQVLSGLGEGDRVILSDMSQWDHADRIDLE